MKQSISYMKIVMSVGMIIFVAALVIGGTGAFFNDTETSTDNTFIAGALDLKIDSVSHYNGMVCTGNPGVWTTDGSLFQTDDAVPADHYPQPGTSCGGTWEETDLGPELSSFFNFSDIKPGDEGENTLSLHVYNNDAWGCMLVNNVVDQDVNCTEPESESTDPECSVDPETPGAGELGQSLAFNSWLDEGSVAGFQCNDPDPDDNPETDDATSGASCEADPQEGDNVLNGIEVLFWENEFIDDVAEGPFDLKEVLAGAYAAHSCTVATGDTDYDGCHGLAADGRMVGSATYYFGMGWAVPTSVGNEAQTDSLTADMIFEVVQHRNNPDFQCSRPLVVTDSLTQVQFYLAAHSPIDSGCAG